MPTMRTELDLENGEILRWEARPAPRCFTFRNWRYALFGSFFLAICLFWQWLGLGLSEDYATSWFAWLPTPFVMIGLYFSFGLLIQARLEWSRVRYAITDRRLLVRRGLLRCRVETMPLTGITYFNLRPHGEQLGTLRVHRGTEQRLVLHCVEYPQQAVTLLEEAVRSGVGAD